MSQKDQLQALWESHKYTSTASVSSTEVNHFAIKQLIKYGRDCKSILDLGCGEGKRLAHLFTGKPILTGIDISRNAITKAQKKYPSLNFVCGNIEELPFEDASFSLVYSAFVFEHISNPEVIIKEAFRVLTIGGLMIIIAPNFGAPNRRSPNSNENKIYKFIAGFIKDINYLLISPTTLNWKRVTPMVSPADYFIDSDTTTEPYLLSLIKFCQFMGFKIVEFSSCWPEETTHNFAKKAVKCLGELGVYPFKYWGPHLFFVVKKV